MGAESVRGAFTADGTAFGVVEHCEGGVLNSFRRTCFGVEVWEFPALRLHSKNPTVAPKFQPFRHKSDQKRIPANKIYRATNLDRPGDFFVRTTPPAHALALQPYVHSLKSTTPVLVPQPTGHTPQVQQVSVLLPMQTNVNCRSTFLAKQLRPVFTSGGALLWSAPSARLWVRLT